MAATYGFEFRYRLCWKPPTIRDLLFKDTEVLTKGDIGNLETGEVDLAATGGDTGLLGAICETVSGTDSTTRVKVIVDADAVYGVTDATARLVGAALDITGTTGAQTVAAKGDDDLVVVTESTTAEETLVMIHPIKHYAYNAT